VPAAAYGTKVGWTAAADPLAQGREKVLGWCIVAVCILGCAASVVMLAKVI
jgi:hypothetical protein